MPTPTPETQMGERTHTAEGVGGRFTLDTSGTVRLPPGERTANRRVLARWSDLTPFQQGYVEALFADFARAVPVIANHGARGGKPIRFSDLAPETLARIIADCEAYEKRYPATRLRTDHRARGANYWRDRQHGLKPLTPYLGGDGRVYLREGA